MIKTDIGEYIVGAYLKVIEKCDFIDYNARPPVAVLESLELEQGTVLCLTIPD
ncbi:MAG: hypothetical protein JXC36_04700 [Candidatus Atribacteria bacterium]|nr:hypothetical protein [Candidatus Atribacteria bacterium]